MNQVDISHTLVGIIAEGSEDWSREFLLDEDFDPITLKQNTNNNQNNNNNNNNNININSNSNFSSHNSSFNLSFSRDSKDAYNKGKDDDFDFNDDFEGNFEQKIGNITLKIDQQVENNNSNNSSKNIKLLLEKKSHHDEINGNNNDNDSDDNDDDDDDDDWEFEEISPSNISNILDNNNQEQKQNQQIQEDEEQEDWDVELGIADEIKEAQDYLADGLRLVINDMSSLDPMRIVDEMMLPTSSNPTESIPLTIPTRCKLANNLLSYTGDVNLVIYPKPPSLYSLKLDHSRKQYTAVEFDGWLQNIVSKHLSRIYSSSQGKDIQWLSHVRSKEKLLTLKLISSWSHYIQILWRNNSIDQLINTLSQFSQLLTQYLPENNSKEKNQLNYSSDDLNELFEFLTSILRISLIVSIDQSINHHKNSQRTSMNLKSPKKRLRINFQFQIMLTNIRTSQKMNTLSEKQKINSNIQLCCNLYHQIFQSCLVLFSFFRDKFALFELQCASYFITMMLEHNIDISWLPKPTMLLQYYITLYQHILKTEKKYKSTKQLFTSTSSVSVSSSTSPSTASSSPSLTSPSNNNSNNNNTSTESQMQNNLKQWSLIKLEILCDIYLFLNGYVPLTITFNNYLQNTILELNQSVNGNRFNNHSNSNNEDDDEDDDEGDEDDEDYNHDDDDDEDDNNTHINDGNVDDDDFHTTEISGEGESDLDTRSIRNNSQDMSVDSKYNWTNTNVSWLQPQSLINEKKVLIVQESDDISLGEQSDVMNTKRLTTNDSIDSNRIDRDDTIPKLVTNRSNMSLLSNQNDNITLFSSGAATNATSALSVTSLLEEIIAEQEDNVSLSTLFHFFYNELNNFYNILRTKYPYISRKVYSKPKILFIMALINLSPHSVIQPIEKEEKSPNSHINGNNNNNNNNSNNSLINNNSNNNNNINKLTNLNEIIESFLFECLLLLDRHSKEISQVIIPSIMTPFGIFALEKLADVLIKNTKYKFGLSCLESILCYHTINTKNIHINQIKLLYRRLITVCQVSNDQKKSLYYYTKILKISKKENKLNEFVYMSELISKLLLDLGEYKLSERCMNVVCMLHFGTSLLSIEFEYIDVKRLEFCELPQGIELPKVMLQINSNQILSTPSSTSLISTQSGSGLWNKRSNNSSTTPSINISAIGNAIVGVGSNNNNNNNNNSNTTTTSGIISNSNHGNNNSNHNSINNNKDKDNNSNSNNNSNNNLIQLTCDSQQLGSVLKLIDVYMVSEQYDLAIDYCLGLLKRKIFPQGRAQILTQLSICYLKIRKLDYCEATLDRIAYEADEIVTSILLKQSTNIPTDSNNNSNNNNNNGNNSNSSNDLTNILTSPRKIPIARYHRPSIDNSTKHSSISSANDLKTNQTRDHSKSISSDAPVIISASALSYVSKIKSYSYLYLRAKCRYLANDPEWAIHWLQIALSVCPKGKWDWRGKIRYLIGKSFSKLCLRCLVDNDGNYDPLLTLNQHHIAENLYATSAEEEFLNSIALYKKNTDIIKQIKCRNRIIELHTKRLFHSIFIEENNIQSACDNKGEVILKSIENLCRTNLQQVGDTSTPMELIRTLVNCSEISWLQENYALASSSWFEARNLLTITYLQHIINSNDNNSGNNNNNNNTTNNTNTKNSTNKSIKNQAVHPGYKIPDVNNPLSDIPVLAISFPTGTLIKIFDILSRIIRLGFFIDPSPLNCNGSTLITSWMRLNNILKQKVTPLFSESQFLQRSLASYTRVFNSSSTLPSPVVNRKSHRDNKMNSPVPFSILAEEISFHTKLPVRKLGREVVPLPVDKLKPNLTRPTINSINRRSKSSTQSTNSFNDSIGYILQGQGDIPGILRQLSSKKSFDEDTNEQKRPPRIMRSYSDVAIAEDIDGVVMEVVSATSNILLPFEMVRKALALESHCDNSSKEGLKAADIVLQHLRNAGKNALLSNFGDDAKNIISRAAAPGITMTTEGYYVPGVLDNSSAESLAKSMIETGVKEFIQEDVFELLKGYSQKTSSNNNSNNKNNNNNIIITQYGEERMKSLFIRLKILIAQYTDGRINLTDLYKKNNEILRKIAKISRGNWEPPKNQVPNNITSESLLDDTLISNSDNEEHIDLSKDENSETPNSTGTIPHSLSFSEIIISEFSQNQYSKIYPSSLRFVILIENLLFLFVPAKEDTSVLILKDRFKATKSHYLSSTYLHQQSFSKDVSDCETLSNATHTTNNSLADVTQLDTEGIKSDDQENENLKEIKRIDSKMSFLSLKSTLKKNIDNRKVKRKKTVPKRKSNYQTLTSTSSTNTLSSTGFSDGKEDSFFALSGIIGRETITSVQPLYYQPLDRTINDAIFSLPLPSEEEFQTSSSSSSLHQIETIIDQKKDQKPKLKSDPSITFAIKLLGIQNLLFLLNTLMMEESILIVGNPGCEQNILHIFTALLRLFRPLQWQHLYIPFLQATMSTIFRIAVKSREPFLIGTFSNVLEGLEETLWSLKKNSNIDYLISSQGGFFSDVTIVDVETGMIKPSRRMRFAATCTLSISGGIVPESDPIQLKSILEKLEIEKERSATISLKPPIPARYRYEIFIKLPRLVSSDELPFLSYIPQSDFKRPFIREARFSKITTRVIEGVQSFMTSLFKGLIFCVKSENHNIEDAKSPVHQRHRHRSTGSEFSFLSRDLLDEEKFLIYVKDDVKPYLQYLFHTRSFKKLVEDISEYKSSSLRLKSSSETSHLSSKMYPSLLQLLMNSQSRLSIRQELYSSLSVERLGGYMTTYFLNLSDPGQPYPFFYTFPYGYEDLIKNKYKKGSIKIKRRWCVLDAHTLTYYKSRSQRLIKDHIRIDPSNVRLITSPFCQPIVYSQNNSNNQSLVQYSNSTTTIDNHRSALEYGDNNVMVFRMDTIDEHIRWVRAIKSRLVTQNINIPNSSSL